MPGRFMERYAKVISKGSGKFISKRQPVQVSLLQFVTASIVQHRSANFFS
jgi:hypothetical protein